MQDWNYNLNLNFQLGEVVQIRYHNFRCVLKAPWKVFLIYNTNSSILFYLLTHTQVTPSARRIELKFKFKFSTWRDCAS
jgi:hypothetical protein